MFSELYLQEQMNAAKNAIVEQMRVQMEAVIESVRQVMTAAAMESLRVSQQVALATAKWREQIEATMMSLTQTAAAMESLRIYQQVAIAEWIKQTNAVSEAISSLVRRQMEEIVAPIRQAYWTVGLRITVDMKCTQWQIEAAATPGAVKIKRSPGGDVYVIYRLSHDGCHFTWHMPEPTKGFGPRAHIKDKYKTYEIIDQASTLTLEDLIKRFINIMKGKSVKDECN